MSKMTRKQLSLEQAFWKCNKIGMNAMPIVVIEDYKILERASDEEKEAMDRYICDRLGFSHNSLTAQQLHLLETNGWI